jgi:hypothetical protein
LATDWQSNVIGLFLKGRLDQKSSLIGLSGHVFVIYAGKNNEIIKLI